jgi:hypothetical protein
LTAILYGRLFVVKAIVLRVLYWAHGALLLNFIHKIPTQKATVTGGFSVSDGANMETVTDEVTEKRGRGRPRKRKLRTDERLLAEIEAGKLDERTKPALAIKQTIRALEDDQKAASLELLRRDIAVNKVLEDVVVNLILNSPESL